MLKTKCPLRQSQIQCKVFCQEHKDEVTHFFIGCEQKYPRLLCQQCLQFYSQILQNEIVEIGTALFEGDTQIKQYFQVLNSWLYNIQEISKVINAIYQKQIILLETFIDDTSKLINRENRKISQILSNINNLGLSDLKFFSEIFIAGKQNLNFTYLKLEDELSQIFRDFLSTKDSLFKEEILIIEKFEQKIKLFIQEINEEVEELQLSQPLSNKEIQILSYSEKKEIAITVHANTINLHRLISEKFSFEHTTIETDHSLITALTFDDKDNKLYLAGEDNHISVWEWDYYLQTYVFKKKSNLDILIIKMISDNDYEKLITFTEGSIYVCDTSQMKIDYQLSDFQQNKICSQIYCSDISNSGFLMICNIQDYLILWKKFNIWRTQVQLKCSKQSSICFINNGQFVSLNQEGTGSLWEIIENKILLISQFKTNLCHLLYCQNIKTLICFNQESYSLYSQKQNKNFQLLFERKCQNLKLCLSNNGEILVIFNNGNLSVWYQIIIIHSFTNKLRC